MSRFADPRQPISPMATGTVAGENEAASTVFDQFCMANTFQGIMSTFHQLCDLLEIRPIPHTLFYRLLKPHLTSWKAKSLWIKLDKRSSHREYKKSAAAKNCQVLIIGSGPCGLRTAIEVALLGGRAVVLEKRDRFSRNNVLHLWPYLIHDLKAFGAKKFFGRFCVGAIDHISIRTLQCILLKVALLMGVEVHAGVCFLNLVEPEISGEQKVWWRAIVSPSDHPLSEYVFDVLVGADGNRNTLRGFKRKEFRGKLAIAITANFINRNTTAEASVEEISGVAFIFNQKFFKDLNERTRIDLENIVYYKDETHYFVMTAKKRSLLDKGVLLQDHDDPARLLSRENVNQEALMSYAREAADVSTEHKLPHLDFAHNHYGQPDVAMFDFTSMFAAEHASRVIERDGFKLLVTLVGDSLLEPFWPTGSGCARGFLGSLDAAWMIRNWAGGEMTPLEVMAERESVYQLLSQTTPENLSKNFAGYTIDPNTRYPNVNMGFFKPHQVMHQYDGTDKKYLEQIVQISRQSSKRYDYVRDSHLLLKWFQRQLESYRSLVRVTDLSASWRNGLGLCALIHKYRPELLDVFKLDPNQVAANNQQAFDIAEKEFGISPVMTGEDMAANPCPDKLVMVSYLARLYEYFRAESGKPAKMARPPGDMPRVKQIGLRTNKNAFNSGARSPTDRKQYSQENQENLPSSFLSNYKRLKTPLSRESRLEEARRQIRESHVSNAVGVRGQNKVSLLAKDLSRQLSGQPTEADRNKVIEPANKVSALAKNLARQLSGEPTDADRKLAEAAKAERALAIGSIALADNCCFCGEKVYLVERHTAEGLFFHRGCFRCHFCDTTLRLGAYAFQRTDEGRFYCFQHVGLEARQHRTRKRSFGDKELLEKLAPVLNRQKPASQLPHRPTGGMGAPTAAAAGALLSPVNRSGHLEAPGSGEALKRTPERIEYDIESEREESELDQTTHNLNASYMSDFNDSDDETDSSPDGVEWSDDECDEDAGSDPLGVPGASWTAVARRYSRGVKQRVAAGSGTSGDLDSDSETPTIGASDADAETDTETENYEDSRLPRLSASAPADPWSLPTTLKSPTVQETKNKRLSFFDTVTEPVRLDPWSFQGFRKETGAPPQQQQQQKPGGNLAKSTSASEVHKTSPSKLLSSARTRTENMASRKADGIGSTHSVSASLPSQQPLQHPFSQRAAPPRVTLSSDEELRQTMRERYLQLLQSPPLHSAPHGGARGAAAVDAAMHWGSESDSIASEEEDILAEVERRRRQRLQRFAVRSDQVAVGSAPAPRALHSDSLVVSLRSEAVSSEDVTSHKSLSPAVKSSPDKDVFEIEDVNGTSHHPTVPPDKPWRRNTPSNLIPPDKPWRRDTPSSLPSSTSAISSLHDSRVPKSSDSNIAASSSATFDWRKAVGNAANSAHSAAIATKPLYSRSVSSPTVEAPPVRKYATLPSTKSATIERDAKPMLSPQNSVQSADKPPTRTLSNEQLMKNKRMFFSASAEPVRIDAKSFFEFSQSTPIKTTDSYASQNTEQTSMSSKEPSVTRQADKSEDNPGRGPTPETGRHAKVMNSDVILETEEEVKEYVKNYFMFKDKLKFAPSEDNHLPDLEPNESEDIFFDDSGDRTLNDQSVLTQTAEFETTSDLIKQNLAVLDDTKLDNLSIMVTENLPQQDNTVSAALPPTHIHSRPDQLQLFPPTESPKQRISVHELMCPEFYPEEVTQERPGEKLTRSSEDSDRDQFDTIKRRRKNDAPKSPVDNKQSVDTHPSPMDTQKAVDELKPVGSPAPLADIDLDITISDTDGELQVETYKTKLGNGTEQENILSTLDDIGSFPIDTDKILTSTSKMDVNMAAATGSEISLDTRTLVAHAQSLIQESKEKIKSDALRLRQQLSDFDQTVHVEKRKSEVERDAIKRIDEMLLSFDQSKETRIDNYDSVFEPAENKETIEQNKLSSRHNSQDTSVTSPILAGHTDMKPTWSSDQVKTNLTSPPGTVLRSLSSPILDNSSDLSFSTPNEAFLVSPPEERLRVITQSPVSRLTREIAERKPANAESESPEGGSPEKVNSMTEFSVADEEGERSFKVDEKFVTEGRRRKKGRPGGSDSSSFTISTPTGSVASTSSLTELNSSRPSNAVTPSTTGEKLAGLRGVREEAEESDQYSLDRLARANARGSGDSLTLHSVFEENLATVGAQPSPLRTATPSRASTKSPPPRLAAAPTPQPYSAHKMASHSAPSSVVPQKKLGVVASSTQVASVSEARDCRVPSSCDSTFAHSVNSSRDELSMYYTPNESSFNDTSDLVEPKSPGARTTKSDSCLDNDIGSRPRKQDSISSNYTSDSVSSDRSLADAKRRFFSQAATPIRLDPRKMFEDETRKVSEMVVVLTAAIPHSNAVVGSNDLFYTPLSRQPSAPNGPRDDPRRLIDDTKCSQSQDHKAVAREVTEEEEEELVVETDAQSKNTQAILRNKPPVRIASREERSYGGGGNNNSNARPVSARATLGQQSSAEDGGKATPVQRSASVVTSKDKKGVASTGAVMKLFTSSKPAKVESSKNKLKPDSESKENKETDVAKDTGKKDKRKSLLSMFRKSTEKKDKEKSKTETASQEDTQPTTSKTDKDNKASKKAHSKAEQKKQADLEAKRRSLLSELVAPLYEHVTRGPQSAVRQRIEQVAPAPTKDPPTGIAPKATASDFDTETEWDSQSIHSVQSGNAQMNAEDIGRLMRKQQRAAKRRQREQEMRRLHMAQEIQRQLEEVEVRQRAIEERGVSIERALRNEGPDAAREEAELMQEWFNMVHEKNVLVRYESELMVHARELELEDRHSRLEQKLRDCVSNAQGEERSADEESILQELVEVVEQRDALVSLLEEDRQREREQETGLRDIMASRGFQLSAITCVDKM